MELITVNIQHSIQHSHFKLDCHTGQTKIHPFIVEII